MEGQKLKAPILAARNIVIFPGTTMPLNVGREKSVAAIKAAEAQDQHILVVAQKSEEVSDPSFDDLYRVGTLCKVERTRAGSDGNHQVILRGVKRVKLTEGEVEGFLASAYEEYPLEQDFPPNVVTSVSDQVKAQAKDILALIPGDTKQFRDLIDALDDLNLILNLAAQYVDLELREKQELLEINSLKEYTLKILEIMQIHKEKLALQNDIRERMAQKLGKLQRDAILREQLKAIKEELGEDDGDGSADDFVKKIEKAKLPKSVAKIAKDEAKRLSLIGPSAPESHVIRSYLELILALPWQKSSKDNLELDHARSVLDGDHYGLEKIKRRIIQHLAVLKLKNDKKGSILLFVGPPGVGKTSLGQSIAKALGREFVRISLGGVRDEAEIRGHRRTYVGAMPGRIVQGLKRVNVNNPVMLLDEIDKLSSGISGDPAAALLEVLDPEQNASFTDHYLDTSFDLSKVFFIATANSLDTIPKPLLDRMEVVELSGYTAAEKLHIAKNHLIPKELKDHGMTSDQVKITDEAILRLIAGYTRESGVRELGRKVSEVLRGTTEAVLLDKNALHQVGVGEVAEILGPERYFHEVAELTTPPGVVTGLAWTPVGGDILFIEASLMPGSGKLILTGQLGDVMKESAQIALSLVRSNLPAFVPGFSYESKDLHIHVPQGAIPKDGPSAGIAMLTTLASLFTGIRVSPRLAMTGEITLRGMVMPVGGIKEKLIAAHRAGIEKVLIPKRNEKDLLEVPEEVKAELRIELVETAHDVIRNALGIQVSLPLPSLPMPQSAAPTAN